MREWLRRVVTNWKLRRGRCAECGRVLAGDNDTRWCSDACHDRHVDANAW